MKGYKHAIEIVPTVAPDIILDINFESPEFDGILAKSFFTYKAMNKFTARVRTPIIMFVEFPFHKANRPSSLMILVKQSQIPL